MTEKSLPGVRTREAEIKELERRLADPTDPYQGDEEHEGRGVE